jgi:hypothetical protein
MNKASTCGKRAFRLTAVAWLLAAGAAATASGQSLDPGSLDQLTPGRVRTQNALWIESPLALQFKTSKRIVLADLKGPAVITMIHFAMSQDQGAGTGKRLDRSLLLRMFWDDEATPSVDTPLVDFFCDPAGTRDEVETALVNVRQGFNAYFPMPFRKSGRIELVYDGALEPGEELAHFMPAYFYVIYRSLDRVAEDRGYFHAQWRQQALLLGKEEYLALDAKGPGKFVGWNLTLRLPGRIGYPVDENHKFYIDGEKIPSVEFQGLEDAFGFSWGFPATESRFPYTGYHPFLHGAAAYRFFVQDSISFEKGLRMTVGFGESEDPMWARDYSRPGFQIQFSSTAYWYQAEPHAAFPPTPPSVDREPAPEQPGWPGSEGLPSADALRSRGVKLRMHCGRLPGEVVFAEPGFSGLSKGGDPWDGWTFPVYHVRTSDTAFDVELTVPKGAKGTVRVYIADTSDFGGGRKEHVQIAGEDMGLFENFHDGRWIEKRLGPERTADGKVVVRAVNAKKGSNAAISIIEWVGDKP